jgi:ATP-dependent NAD(P)H-hydrate dehydratase
LVDSVQGGLKRVGGQGDILSGTVGTLLAWGREWARGSYAHVGSPADPELAPHVALLAAYGASAFARTVSKRGFELKGRSMVTHDLVDLVGPVYADMFGGEVKGKL